MKIGDYVRTNDGRIFKITKEVELEMLNRHNGDDRFVYAIKTSESIIDLIEVGDYVNGEKVIQEYNPEGKYVLWIKLSNGEFIDSTNQEYIKSIVTKEEFEYRMVKL